MTISFLLAFTLLFSLPQRVSAQSAPAFSFSESDITVDQGGSTTVDILLNAFGHQVSGVDLVLEFDSTVLDISQIEFDSPSIFPYNFFVADTTTNPERAILKTSSSFVKPDETFSTSDKYATLHLTAKESGISTIKLRCTQDSTTDTNIAERLTGHDLIQCNDLTALTINVSSATSQDSFFFDATGPDTSTIGGECPAPATPTNLEAFAVDLDTILLTWGQVSQANNYSLLFGTNSTNFQFGASNFGYTNRLLVNYLAPNTTYYFGLSAVNECGTGSPAYISGRTLAPKPGTDYTVTSSRYLPSSPTPNPNIAELPTTPDPNAIYKPQVTLSDTEIENTPSLDNILTVENQPVPLDNTNNSDESPTTNKPNPQIALILISFIIITPAVVVFILRHRNSDVISS